jgi:RNA polymerase sigma factor (sigma-70 family)
VIFLTERCEIRTTVAALRRGAVTILEEPLLETEYEEAVRLALAWRQSARQDHEASQRVRAAFDQLTDEELQVLRLVSAGLANKQVATRLKVSVRTVEDRRRRAMGKLDVGSFAELVRLTVAWESLDQR